MNELGFMEGIRQCYNDDILFPKIKPIRNVPQYARKNAQPRNEKCACGSGLKYKKCCGK